MNVGGKAMNSIKKAVAIKSDSEEAKPLVATATSNGRQVVFGLKRLTGVALCGPP